MVAGYQWIMYLVSYVICGYSKQAKDDEYLGTKYLWENWSVRDTVWGRGDDY